MNTLNIFKISSGFFSGFARERVNPLNAELNPICHFLALLGAYHILHVSRIRVKVSSEYPLWQQTMLWVALRLTLSRSDRRPSL